MLQIYIRIQSIINIFLFRSFSADITKAMFKIIMNIALFLLKPY